MVVVAVITLGVAMKAEDVVELAPARGRLALDVFMLKPCFLYIAVAFITVVIIRIRQTDSS
eukprot:COSAG01_NODE_9126_length_2543_cov_14.023322_3_plen_61_part_00